MNTVTGTFELERFGLGQRLPHLEGLYNTEAGAKLHKKYRNFREQMDEGPLQVPTYCSYNRGRLS
jgi:hypothetical protein